MVPPKTLAKYYSLYLKIREIPRFTIKEISPALQDGGRGRKYSTISDHVRNFYAQKISLRPNLVLRTYENYLVYTYFLKIKKSESITSAFYSLKENTKLLYMLFLSGAYDFFVTSQYDLKFKNFKIVKKSISYTPYYTCPQGWNRKMKDSLHSVAESTLSKGKLKREIEDWLPWEDFHFKIYEIMKNNVQMPFSKVADLTRYAQTTVKRYFYRDILPYCDISHYFFPKGYDYYEQAFIVVRSEYEKGLYEAFSKLPCTSYFLPFEEEIAIGIFHESIGDLMHTIRKLEEKGYIEKYLLLVPLHWK